MAAPTFPGAVEEETRVPERFAAFLDQRQAAADRPDWRPSASTS